MEFKFKEPHKETKEIMAKVAQGENPYLMIKTAVLKKTAKKGKGTYWP